MSDSHSNIDRRSFMRMGALGTAAAVSGIAGARNLLAAEAAAPAVRPVLRTLGPTGMKITDR